MYFFEQPSRLDAALLMDSARLWITLLYTVRRIGPVMPSATVVLYFQLVILIDCLVVRKVYGHPCYRHCKCKMSSKIMYAFLYERWYDFHNDNVPLFKVEKYKAIDADLQLYQRFKFFTLYAIIFHLNERCE